MSKKLKIQFWRAEKALAMQILEQEGLPKEKKKGDVKIFCSPKLRDDFVFLRGGSKLENLNIAWITFNTDSERDEYLQKAVNAITDELFTGEGELKVGEICEVRSGDYVCWHKSELIAILPKKYTFRYFTKCTYDDKEFLCWRYARPIAKRTEPKIEECGQLITYTWEEK